MAKPVNSFDYDISYDVWVFDEVDALTNFMMALSVYRRKNGKLWPSLIRVAKENRLAQWQFDGAAFEVKADMKMALKDAIYIAYYKAWEDLPEVREPTKKPEKRTPAIAGVPVYRSRKDIRSYDESDSN